MDDNILRTVLAYGGLSSSAKVLWMRLYLLYAYGQFTTIYKDIADKFGVKTWTLQSNMRLLMKAKAVKVQRNYDENGRTGSTFVLVEPNKWKRK